MLGHARRDRIEVSAADRERLERIVADRNSPQKHVWRARSSWRRRRAAAPRRSCAAPRCPSPASGAGRSGSCAKAWPGWCATRPQAGPAALAAGRGRAGGRADAGRAARRDDPLDRPRHGGGQRRSLRSVQRIWAAHGLQPHRVRRFKLSTDPAFAAKLRDVVGLYLDPPAHSLVLSVDRSPRSRRSTATSRG